MTQFSYTKLSQSRSNRVTIRLSDDENRRLCLVAKKRQDSVANTARHLIAENIIELTDVDSVVQEVLQVKEQLKVLSKDSDLHKGQSARGKRFGDELEHRIDSFEHKITNGLSQVSRLLCELIESNKTLQEQVSSATKSADENAQTILKLKEAINNQTRFLIEKLD